MTSLERVRETLAGSLSLAIDRAARVAAQVGVRPRAIHVMVREIPVPATPLVASAHAALAGAEPWVLAHSMRTYVFGQMLALRDGKTADAEVLLLASLLHDVGLVHREGAACFALRGALHARSVLAASPETAARVADAICAHLNVRPASFGAEAALLRAGAGLDVAGDRFDHLDAETRRDVARSWPRNDFARSVSAALRAEAAHRGTRISFLCRALGFPRLITQADRRFVRDMQHQ